MERFYTGLCSVSFRDRTAEKIISAAAEAGLRYIEWGSDVHAPAGDEARLKEVSSLGESFGIRCSSYGTYFRIGRDAVEDIYKYINAAALLGTRVLRVWCGRGDFSAHSEAEEAELFSSCKALAEIAKREGVILACERHRGTYTDSAVPILRLMEAVDSPNFRMYWQPDQYHSPQENLAELCLTSRYTVNVHVFNWERDTMLPLSEAASVWREYLSLLRGEHTLLLEFMPDGQLATLGREAAALFDILKKEGGSL